MSFTRPTTTGPCIRGVVLVLVFIAGCSRPDPQVRQGYIEGDFVYVASPLAGKLEKLAVRQGAQAKKGELLFELENAAETAARNEAQRRLAQARAGFQDARKGRRPSEIDSIRAQLKQAQSALEFAHQEFARQEKLARTPGATTQQELDRARATRDQNQARVAQLEAELQTAQLGSRVHQVAAAQANMQALEAALARAEVELGYKRQQAPQPGLVFDTLYREGEWVAAGRPVVMLLPPENVKLRVFVPATWLGSLKVGDAVQVSVDGAPAPVAAKVSFISPQAEYTPPVIYSRENRSKLVFLVEARFEPEAAARLHPGLPVDVRFQIAVRP